MKPISYEKDKGVVIFLKKQMSNRKVADVVDLLNGIRKKHFENIVIQRRGCP